MYLTLASTKIHSRNFNGIFWLGDVILKKEMWKKWAKKWFNPNTNGKVKWKNSHCEMINSNRFDAFHRAISCPSKASRSQILPHSIHFVLTAEEQFHAGDFQGKSFHIHFVFWNYSIPCCMNSNHSMCNAPRGGCTHNLDDNTNNWLSVIVVCILREGVKNLEKWIHLFTSSISSYLSPHMRRQQQWRIRRGGGLKGGRSSDSTWLSYSLRN